MLTSDEIKEAFERRSKRVDACESPVVELHDAVQAAVELLGKLVIEGGDPRGNRARRQFAEALALRIAHHERHLCFVSPQQIIEHVNQLFDDMDRAWPTPD